MNKPIETYSIAKICELIEGCGQPAFRSKQLIEWLYRHDVSSYDAMTNLPKTLRESLSTVAPIYHPAIEDRQISSDGTRKYVFRLYDGALVESVGIPSHSERDRLTVCFSTQVGCAMQCRFCATGSEGFTRNLGSGEIVRQILEVQKDMKRRVTNIVAMGQGEPFFNYDNLRDALTIANNKKGVGIGARRITVSTCGVLSGIDRFSSEPEQFTLAVSLHAARQAVRNSIMPRCSSIPLKELKQTLLNYVDRTNRRVTLEYLMIDGINDAEQDLRALESFCDGLLCHINFLPINKIPGSPFQPSHKSLVQKWIDYFTSRRIEATLRTSRGADIDGACGQLKNSIKHR